MQKEKPTRFRQMARDHFRRVKGSLFLAALCMLGLAVTDLLRPWPLKLVFDHILSDKPLPPFLSFLGGTLQSGKTTALVAISFCFILIALVRAAISYFEVYITSRIGNQMVYSLRRELFAHIQRLSLSFHNRAGSGELLTKIASDTTLVKDMFAETVVTFVLQTLTIIGMFAIMFYMDWRLALIVLATFPILAYNLLRLYGKAKASARRARKKEEKIATRINQVLNSATLVQAFGRAKYETERFESESMKHLNESNRNALQEAVATRTVEITTAVGTAAVVLFGSMQVLKGEMTVGTVYLFVSYLTNLYRPMRSMTRLSARSSKAMVSAQRIAEVLEVEPEIQDRPDAIEAKDLKGEIIFDNVSFDYGDGKDVLKNVSFVVSPGQQVALVGVSGGGKSTIASLILRLYDPQEGSILIDGVNIKDYRHESLRRQIGIVLQESILVGASIKENIAYGKLDATPEEIAAAARAANAHDFILGLENGYDTVIGERGETLSGGQRRRIAIARALIRNAPILILDEPMTGLDVESEAKVREAVKRLMAGKSCLLITHDLQAVADADLVLVLEGGRIVERGKHSDLVVKSRYYRETYEFKFGQRESEEFSM